MSVLPDMVAINNAWEQPVYEVHPPEAPDMHYEDERDELKSELAASQKAIQAARRLSICALVVAVVVSVGSVVAALLISLAVRKSTDEYVLLTRLNSLSDVVDTNSDAITVLDGDVDSVSGSVDSLDTEMDSLASTVSAHTSSLASVSADLSSLESGVADIESDVSDIESDVTTVTATVAAHTSSLASVSASVSALDVASTAADSDITSLSASVATLESSVSTLDTDVTALAVYADPNASYSDIKAILMDGVTVNTPIYTRTTYTTADDALSAVRAYYTGVTVWETVEKDIASVKFSSVYSPEANYADCANGHTLRDRGLSVVGCWLSGSACVDQYAMVVYDTPTLVGAISTAGRPTVFNEYVETYAIEYFDPALDEWVSVVESMASFVGNTDMNTVVLHTLSEPVVADRLRVRVLSWYGYVSMRLEVYGWQ
ncbi:hypothetical protein KIPB_003466 [Kipferlia bialata]|uniref:F5/8 type C domain-containing protein n=1 Tax=Kipferlia bialata TaxID=797122 RepID=A0A9K3GGP1_9EUKA|nr:hypothetical protein KIPB_003466 [Kipferlia bialata]|eukprot:g3466.t1